VSIDWDDPKNLPESSAIQPGQSVSGQITHLSFEPNLRGALTLTWAVDGGRKRWANSQLWRAMGDARVQVGDRVTVTRGPDEPSTGQYPRTTWRVERHTGPVTPFQAQPAPQAQPQATTAQRPENPVGQVPAW
jgi:hypothetical protein